MKTELNSGAGEGKPRLRALPELLSPAGSPEALAAAIAGGADAVYLGGRLLNARMRARNFDDDALREAVRRCHGAGVRIFVTLNTIVYDRECDEAVRYAAFLYEAGADALIIADLGLAERIKHMPDFEFMQHSAFGHNAAAADFFARRVFRVWSARASFPKRISPRLSRPRRSRLKCSFTARSASPIRGNAYAAGLWEAEAAIAANAPSPAA